MNIAATAKSIVIAIGSCCLVGCTWFGITFDRNHHLKVPPASENMREEQIELHSSLPYHEVSIPFTLDYGVICVKANLAGKEIQCAVDTGCDYPRWNHALNLKGDYRRNAFTTNDLDGNEVTKEEVILPSIQVGNLLFNNARTYAVSAPPKQKRPLDNFLPFLGNSIFKDLVVTIDFVSQILLVRDATYDITTRPIHRGATLSDLSSYPSDSAIPLLLGFPGNLNHKPIHWKIDTGSAYGVVISQEIAKEWNLPSVSPAPVNVAYNVIRKGAYTAHQLVEIAGQEYNTILVTHHSRNRMAINRILCPLTVDLRLLFGLILRR